MRIYVGNLSYRTTSLQLRDIFGAYGRVYDATVVSDRDTAQSKGFGFIDMAIHAEADEAIRQLDQTDLDGRTIRVSVAKERARDKYARG